uniref:N(6)-L-threonylcarbamoyladenine synthase n=2 Tax=Clastoptera arizonana TaxID=38151 RepID=A0A1B6DRA7_9HEMI
MFFSLRRNYKVKEISWTMSKLVRNVSQQKSGVKTAIILGIETSCDDTGCAVVDTNGNILGEALHSQQQIHLENGGILPPIARDLHEKYIEKVVKDALQAAKLKLSDVDAIATTVKPGLALSLCVGMLYGKHLSRQANKPFIPIHHMQAHALTVRMVHKVDFPFLVLLVSGGHCILAVVQSATSFLVLGHSLDDAPGEAMDKAARRLKLRNLPQFSKMCGGQALEKAAELGDPLSHEFTTPLTKYRDCNFSYAGIKNQINRLIIHEEEKYNVQGGKILPNVYNICASFQLCVTKHICHRVQRAIEFVKLKQLIPKTNQIMVMSGGVACNSFISRAVGIVCRETKFQLRVPPPHLCTDNGIMIAWNGAEKWSMQKDVYSSDNLDDIDIESRCPMGEDMRKKVTDANIKCEWVSLNELFKAKDSLNSKNSTNG